MRRVYNHEEYIQTYVLQLLERKSKVPTAKSDGSTLDVSEKSCCFSGIPCDARRNRTERKHERSNNPHVRNKATVAFDSTSKKRMESGAFCILEG